MDEFKLPIGEIKRLRVQYRGTKRKRDADRIKTIVLLGTGWTVAQVSEVLLMDVDTIKSYRARYQEGGLLRLLKDQYKAKQANLSRIQLTELSAHMQAELYMTVQEIIVHVKRQRNRTPTKIPHSAANSCGFEPAVTPGTLISILK